MTETTEKKQPTPRTAQKPKVEEPQETIVVEENVKELPPRVPSTIERYIEMSRIIREKGKNLKFDSEIDNIGYVYVDTQQYKDLLGAASDIASLGMIYDVIEDDLTVTDQPNPRGGTTQVFTEHIKLQLTFFSEADERTICITGTGLATSKGGTYATSSAQTNALRNIITNNFSLRTNDREGDDVRQGMAEVDVGTTKNYLTDSQKAEERSKRLNETATTVSYPVITFASMFLERIEKALANPDIPPEFSGKLKCFIDQNYVNGAGIPNSENKAQWCVAKTDAMALLTEVDKYA